MNERRTSANRFNAKLSTGPASYRGKQKSARNALKHGLSIAIDPAAESVRALTRLLLPTPCNDYLRALAVEAARKIIDHNRVRDAYQDIYRELHARYGDALDSPFPERLLRERGGSPKIAANEFVEMHFGRIRPLSISDLAKQLDKLARYDRRTLSARERALAELDRAIERSYMERELKQS
jgi:hypothetical protein